MSTTTVELRANITAFHAKLAIAREDMNKTASAGKSSFSGLSAGVAAAGAVIAGGAVTVGAASIKMAANFQESMTSLVTGAGEMQSNLSGDMKGVQKLMGETGTSAQQLAAGLYMINSAGYHGGAGLTVLKAASEGAKVTNADLATVDDAGDHRVD